MKLIIENNIVKESYLGFIYNDNLEFIRGGVDENGLASHPIYDANKAVVMRYFNPEECYYVDRNSSYSDLATWCYRDGLGLYISIEGDVTAQIRSNSYMCQSSYHNATFCEYID